MRAFTPGAGTLTARTADDGGGPSHREHGGANGAGQNLASAASTAVAEQSGSDAVAGWMSEEKLYDPSNPTYSHFIQVS